MALPAEVLATLPEDIRGSEHIAAYNDVGSIVKDLIGAKTADWKAGLPDELKAEASITGFKGVGDLAKSFVETKKLVGQSLRAPATDASEEDWEKYYKAGGKPNNPDEYKVSIPEGIVTKEEEKAIRERAHRLGLNSRQVQKVVDLTVAEVAEMQKAERDEKARIDASYKEKWGANYGRNNALIDRTIERVDPEKKLQSFLEATGLRHHPVMIDLFLNWSKRLVEDGLMPEDVEGVPGRDEAKTAISKIMNDPKHPYHTSKTGDAAFEEMRKLQELAWN